MQRRTFLRALVAPAVATAARGWAAPEPKMPRIAAVVTEYRENSHADVIVTKFLEGCKTLDVEFRPRSQVVSLYLDQVSANDIGREMARKHQVPVVPSIEQALTLGTGSLAVDGVLLIGEHGLYPYNEVGQHMYPRRRFFEEVAKVFRRSGRSVPVFNDKHLSATWADARWVYDTARELRVPFMAGSSLPYTWKKPEPLLPPGAQIPEALAVGYGGTEAYGFHALEALQSVVERRKGGETGVRSVQCVSGDAVWKAGDAGRWSWPLLLEALGRSEKSDVRSAGREGVRRGTKEPDAFLIEYENGLRATVLMLYGLVEEFLFAARPGESAAPVSTLFWLQPGKPFGHFARMSAAIDRMFVTGRPVAPIERTLLTTGILDAAMRSRHDSGRRLDTPELGIRYQPPAPAPG